MARLKAFLATFAYSVFAIVSGAIVLTGGYWLSDVLYAAGLWPLGAMMRIVLLFMAFGFVMSFIAFTFLTVRILFVADWDD